MQEKQSFTKIVEKEEEDYIGICTPILCIIPLIIYIFINFILIVINLNFIAIAFSYNFPDRFLNELLYGIFVAQLLSLVEFVLIGMLLYHAGSIGQKLWYWISTAKVNPYTINKKIE